MTEPKERPLEELARYKRKFEAAEKKLNECGFMEVYLKFGLDWQYRWEINPEYKHRYDECNDRG